MFEHRRRRAALVFLVHAVEQRQPQLGGIDNAGFVAAPAQRAVEKSYQPDAGSCLAHGAVQDGDMQ